MYFQKRGRGRSNESKHLRLNDSSRPLNPGAELLLTHTGCLIYRLHRALRNVSFEECLPRQIAGGGGEVLAVTSIT